VFQLGALGILIRFTGLATRVLGKSGVVLAALTHFTYVALILVLMIAGAGVPIPEDIPLIFSGYLCNKEYSPIKDITVWVDTNKDGIKDTEKHRRVPHLELMIAAGLLGVLLGDSIVFTIGRHGIESRNLVARHLRKVMHSKRREKVERHFARHGNLTVFVGRFMPGFRSIVFAFAGLSKMSYYRFLLIDGLAAALSVPTFILLGWHFADRIDWLIRKIDQIKHWAIPVILLIVVVGLVVYLLRRRRQSEPAA
jgi:membrane protein DedA with SNARE-associated domain